MTQVLHQKERKQPQTPNSPAPNFRELLSSANEAADSRSGKELTAKATGIYLQPPTPVSGGRIRAPGAEVARLPSEHRGGPEAVSGPRTRARGGMQGARGGGRSARAGGAGAKADERAGGQGGAAPGAPLPRPWVRPAPGSPPSPAASDPPARRRPLPAAEPAPRPPGGRRTHVWPQLPMATGRW